MNRRELFLTFAAAAAVSLPVPSWAQSAKEPLDYSKGLVKKHLDAGHVVFLDFKAVWCSTCQTQGRILKTLKEKNPDYLKRITFINVDWDTYRDSDIVREMRIPRRSTLVVLRGDQELGRLVAVTAESQIKGLLDLASAAAG